MMLDGELLLLWVDLLLMVYSGGLVVTLRHFQEIIFKNAFANLCRGGAAVLVAILLPPFLMRILSKDAYGT
jgi:hypothetical protein